MRTREQRDEETLRIGSAVVAFVLAVTMAVSLAALGDMAGLWEFDALSEWTPAVGLVAAVAYLLRKRA